MPKNSLITKGTIYSKLYDNLRGVDFSSDHTRVADNRFAYLCNMYKDYKSAQGNGVETIPGYREIADCIDGNVNGIHEYKYIVDGEQRSDIFVHIGTNLYKWINFPEPQNVNESRTYTLGAYTESGDEKTFAISVEDCSIVNTISYELPGNVVGFSMRPILGWPGESKVWDSVHERYNLSFNWPTSADITTGDTITLRLKRYTHMTALKGDMADHKSVSFSFNNYLYILDGTNFIRCNTTEVKDVEEDAYVPTIYIRGIPAGVNATIGTEYEQRNILSPFFKQTYVADGTSQTFNMAVPNLETISSLKIYGKEFVNNRLKVANMTTFKNFLASNYDSIDGDYYLQYDVNTGGLKIMKSTESSYSSSYSPSYMGLTVDTTEEIAAVPSFVRIDPVAWKESSFGSLNHSPYSFECQGDINEWVYYPAPGTSEGDAFDLLSGYGVSMDLQTGKAHFVDSEEQGHEWLVIGEVGVPTSYRMHVRTVNDIVRVLTYDQTSVDISLSTGEITILQYAPGYTAPPAPENVAIQDMQDTKVRCYPKGYAGIEITAAKQVTSVNGIVVDTEDVPNLIKGCTMVCMFDGRVFLSGNPKYPNNVFWCGRNLDTGLIDPSYWGLLNYVSEGVETVPVTAMLAVSDTLAVLKGNTSQDGSVFYHTAYETGENLIPVTYPSKQGLAGTGCLGASANFLDDPVFISKYGLEAIGQLSVRLERALEHRSTLVDAKLLNLDMSKAQLNVWEGYLILSIDGHVFMADSRQPYANGLGIKEYEWYYLEGIGSYSGQYDEYRYASRLQWDEHEPTIFCTACNKPAEECTCGNSDHHIEIPPKKISFCQHCGKPASACTCGTTIYQVEIPLEAATEVYEPSLYQTVDLSGTVANPPGANGNSTVTVYETTVQTVTVYGTPGETRTVHYVIRAEELPQIDDEAIAYAEPHAYLVEATGAKIGGVYRPAQLFKAIGEHLLFGTNDGKIFCFNNDKRNEDGSIDADWYTFDGRTIECGCATKMDNCDIPHLTKTTVKKSIVIKTKKFDFSAAKIKVRTNRNVFNQVARINSMVLDFTKMDFEDFSFSAAEKDLFMIKEKERQWVEKQYYIYSDEYKKPFALYYLAYRYYVIGRYKNR